jgi:hypothetical protein
MRKTLLTTSIIAMMGLLGVGPALAGGGGMGDVDAHTRDINRLCDMQRRGEAPPSPSFCLPELPPGPVYDDRHSRQ